MARTPVLLAMMRRTVPRLVRKSEDFGTFPQLTLYRAYTERWICRDEGRAHLSSVQRERLSRRLAVYLFERDEPRATWEEIRALLHADPLWLENPVEDPVAEMDVRNSTFLVRESDRDFRFVHRSIMEFLAAEDSLDTLARGDRIERVFSDGQADFLSMALAERWILDRAFPSPRRELDVADRRDSQLLSLMAAASQRVTPEKSEGRLELSNLSVKGGVVPRSHFNRALLANMTINVERIENLSFRSCVMQCAHIRASSVGVLQFFDLEATDSTVELDVEGWKKVAIYPGGNEIAVSLGLDSWLETASRWVSQPGCRAIVAGTSWTVPQECLAAAADIAKRLRGRSKISKDAWYKGTSAHDLNWLLDCAKRATFVVEDESRVSHQLELAQEGIRLFTAIEHDPFSVQGLLLKLRPED
jgi:hypothetical protein